LWYRFHVARQCLFSATQELYAAQQFEDGNNGNSSLKGTMDAPHRDRFADRILFGEVSGHLFQLACWNFARRSRPARGRPLRPNAIPK
jgi:hypothetical protein